MTVTIVIGARHAPTPAIAVPTVRTARDVVIARSAMIDLVLRSEVVA